MLKRRGFLGGILAAGFAPAFIGSQVLMPVRAIAKPRQWQDLLNTEAMARAVDDDVVRMLEQTNELLQDMPDPRLQRTIIGAGLSRGDIFTIAGDKTHYRVTRVVSGVAHIQPW